MEVIIYIVCFLVLLRYGYVLIKYLKTKEFKKKKCKSNIWGIIAYSFLTTLIICFLIFIILVSKNKSNNLLMWIIFISSFGTLIIYPCFWQQRTNDNEEEKKIEMRKKIKKEYNLRYGDDEEYFKIKTDYFTIPDDCKINEKFNELISIITNEQITFIHPKEYKNIAEVFSFLIQKDFMKLLDTNDSIILLCNKINSLLKNNRINLEIKQEDITKNDDKFIKIRRKNMIPTFIYDLNEINEIIKLHLDDYEVITAHMFKRDNSFFEYPVYLCLVKKSKYNKFFGKLDKKEEEPEDLKDE